MKITSLFLPPDALQGQDIPSHVLWKENGFSEIEIKYPNQLCLAEIYNVAQGNYTNENNTILIKHVDIEGYLGLVFKSTKQPTNRSNASIDYTFRHNSEVRFHATKSVHLFRPDLILVDAPDIISIQKDGRFDKRIALSNQGEGTAIVLVRTTPGSTLKQVQPTYVREFFDSFFRDVNTRLARLKDEFPTYSALLEEMINPEQTTDSNQSPDVQDSHSLQREVQSILERDSVFAKKLVEVYVSCILGNIHFRTLAEVFLDYINSLGTKRTLFVDPFSVIEVPTGESSIELQIESRDLLNSEYGSLPILKILLRSEEACEIPLYKFIRWD